MHATVSLHIRAMRARFVASPRSRPPASQLRALTSVQSPIFSDVKAKKKAMISLLKKDHSDACLYSARRPLARGRLCCSSLVCTLKKAVITDDVRSEDTIKKLLGP